MANLKKLPVIIDDGKYRVQQLLDALYKHLEYSFNDIDSYDELTEEEKKIIPKEMFEYLTEKDINSEKDKDNLSNVLSARANKEKRKSLYNAIEEKFGKRPDNISEAIATLVANHIDITSNDLDTIEGLVKCHH